MIALFLLLSAPLAARAAQGHVGCNVVSSVATMSPDGLVTTGEANVWMSCGLQGDTYRCDF